VKDLVALLLRHGTSLVFGNVLLEQLGLPIPAVPTLVVAGALAADGRLSFARLLFAAYVATVGADSLWFLLGRRYGQRILKALCRVSLSPDTCVRQTEGVFEKYGVASLLLAKFVPGYSTVAPPLAGAAGVSYPRFFVFTSGGTLLWAGSGLLLGAVFHGTVDRALAFLSQLGGWAFVLLAAGLLLYILFKWVQRRRFYRFLRMARIRAAELRALMDAGESPVVVDVRSHAARERDPRKIPGALTLDLEDLDAHVALLPADREIVLYCT
jgi:membrane protein DedA with SNARE-associated domain